MSSAPTAANVRRAKHTLLPGLVFLLAVSYGLPVLIIVFQNRTIDAQVNTIQLLFNENHHLQTIAGTHKNPALGNKPHTSQGGLQSQSPSPRAQAPSTQVQASPNVSQIPSSQEKPANRAKPGRERHNTRKRSPFSPPSELTDPSDMRRSLITI